MESVIYCRVSSEKQSHGVSLDAQEITCKRYCEERGWVVIKVIREVANSAKIEKQKLLNGFISDDTLQGNNGCLVVFSTSRLCRNVKDGLSFVTKLNDKGWGLKSISEDYDITTGSGMFHLTNILNAAEFERKVIGDRVRNAIQFRKSMGSRFGRVPYGYKSIMSSQNGTTIRTFEIDNTEQAILSFIKLARTRGTSQTRLTAAMSILSPFAEANPIRFNVGYQVRRRLGWDNIASLLNEYGLSRRGRSWTSTLVACTNKHL